MSTCNALIETRWSTMSGLRILIVDDDPEIVAVVGAFVRSLGHKPVPTAAPREALAIIYAAGDLDLVLTDCGMPEIDGIELAARVYELRPDLPVLFMTCRPDFISFLHRENLPVLVKPFGLAELTASMESAAAQIIRY